MVGRLGLFSQRESAVMMLDSRVVDFRSIL